MKIGISTASFYPLETDEAVRLIAKNNVDCCEVFFNSRRELKDSFCDLLLDIADSTGLKFTSIHPILSFAEPYMVFSEYIRRFEESQEDYKRYGEIAATLGAKFINLHGDRPNGKLPVEEYCERFLKLSEITSQFGVTLCQENVNGYRSADPEFLRDMVEILGDKVNFTLDIKQSVRAGYTPYEIAESMNYQIKHLHISDHSPAGDCLLPLRGGFNFKEFFTHLKSKGFSGDSVIEVYQNAYKEYTEIFESYKKIKDDSYVNR